MTGNGKRPPGRPSKPKDQQTVTFSVRMLPSLRERLEEAAAQGGRSLNAEIVYRLRDSFDSADPERLRQKLWSIEDRVTGWTAALRELADQREALIARLEEAGVLEAALASLRKAGVVGEDGLVLAEVREAIAPSEAKRAKRPK